MSTGFKARKHLRFKASMPAKVREVGKFTWLQGTMINLSRGGICMTILETVAPGTKLEMEFFSVDREGVSTRRRLRGIVMWRRANRYGIRFGSSAEKKKKA